MASNGDTLRRLMLQFARRVDHATERRIESTIAFLSSMVDRIVPAANSESSTGPRSVLACATKRRSSASRSRNGSSKIVSQAARPEWELAAPCCERCPPYQAMKLRLLNGTHSAIAYLGQLWIRNGVRCDARSAGQTVRATADDRGSARRLAAPAGYVLAYCDQLLRRFGLRRSRTARNRSRWTARRRYPALAAGHCAR
jgi:fructuronate reductase